MPAQPTSSQKSLILFGERGWDRLAFGRLRTRWPQVYSGFDLFKFPSNLRLCWLNFERYALSASLQMRRHGAQAAISTQEHFGALIAALIAERHRMPGPTVSSILTCQHKLYARHILERVAPEANLRFARLDKMSLDSISDQLSFPVFVKPIRAAFSVLASRVDHPRALHQRSHLNAWDHWVIRRLIDPFEQICARRIPEAGSAHGMIIETCQRGEHYCLDGYYFRGQLRILGVVGAQMYPGTHAFMRFDYPSKLSESIVERAAEIADRFFSAIQFHHGLFNMEFFYHEPTDELKVIEVNPRMASQFSELYQRVSGVNLHEICLALAHDIDPLSLERGEPENACASSFVYRSFGPILEHMWPTSAQVSALSARHPRSMLFTYPQSTRAIARELRWVGSYRYAVLFLGGSSPQDLNQRCHDASETLGWPAPTGDADHNH